MKFKIVILLVLIVSLPQLVISQSINYNTIGAGARARGMGGAFIGVADDATAASWNPWLKCYYTITWYSINFICFSWSFCEYSHG